MLCLFCFVLNKYPKTFIHHNNYIRGTQKLDLGVLNPRILLLFFAKVSIDHAETLAYEYFSKKRCGNDPSAGSPTETLLRLHLPLNDEV